MITNVGSRPAPCMVLYHINLGFPLLDDGTELLLPGTKLEPRDEVAKEGMEEYGKMHAPVVGYEEKVYFHTLRTGADGVASVAVVNREAGARGAAALRAHRTALLHGVEDARREGVRAGHRARELPADGPGGGARRRAADRVADRRIGGDGVRAGGGGGRGGGGDGAGGGRLRGSAPEPQSSQITPRPAGRRK